MMMNSPGMSPSMDAIQEFRVLDNTSAEFGRSSGSNVNLVIKSGTRDLRGSVYEYLRNDKFDAADFFANKNATGKLPYRQNQYGVAVGGPVIWDQTGQDQYNCLHYAWDQTILRMSRRLRIPLAKILEVVE